VERRLLVGEWCTVAMDESGISLLIKVMNKRRTKCGWKGFKIGIQYNTIMITIMIIYLSVLEMASSIQPIFGIVITRP
jgi:hypothetical protein